MLVETILKLYIETKFNTDIIGVNVKLEKKHFELVTITLMDKRNCQMHSAIYLLSYLTMLDNLSFDSIIDAIYFTLAKMGRQSS